MEDEKLIELVKTYPELFDKKNKFYLDTNRKEKIWKQIQCNFDKENNAKKRWTYLRDRYTREKKKQQLPSGSASALPPPWYLFEQLRFLDDHLRTRRVRENVVEEEGIENVFEENIYDFSLLSPQSDIIEEITLEEITGVSADVESLSRSTPNCGQGRSRKRKNEMNDVDKLVMEQLRKIGEKINEKSESDEYDCFLKLIKIEMKKMTEEEKTGFQLETLKKAKEAARRSQ